MVAQWYHPSQFCVICKPSVGALYPIVQVTNGEVKEQRVETITRTVFFRENPKRAQRTKITAKLSKDRICILCHALIGDLSDAIQLGVPSI